ncbi:MAG: 2,3-bisphosphoglycerate-independent phosphoglycerate mutase [Candidatus Omnitrophica bacterium]|nr:2,3-bisphosphoglycerate-independent phosphoglycerate mutase [Candidatus Omnitrophota bacterium]
MKYLVIIPDGIGDRPSEALGGKTPLEVARIPNLNYFARIGKVGTVRTVPDREESSSHIAFSTLLGYEPRQFNIKGPGPLEAANLEVKLEDNEIAFRMNLVTESDGVLADSTAGHIMTREAKALINFLNKKLASDFVRFFAGTGHRHIAVIKDAQGFQALSAQCFEPYAIVGKRVEDYLPKGPGQDLIKKLMYDARLLLQDHEINQVRIDLGENPANMVWLWGQGSMPKLPKFSERSGGLSGASISTEGVIQGFSRLIGLTVVESSSVHAFPDFDYEGQADQMMELISEKDFVCLHARACHEAGREGNIKQKVLSLEAIDHHIVGAAKSFYENQKDVRILIAPLLNVPSQTRAYARESVPFILAGKNMMPDEIERFSEATAQLSRLRVKEGWKLMDLFIGAKDLEMERSALPR